MVQWEKSWRVLPASVGFRKPERAMTVLQSSLRCLGEDDRQAQNVCQMCMVTAILGGSGETNIKELYRFFFFPESA